MIISVLFPLAAQPDQNKTPTAKRSHHISAERWISSMKWNCSRNSEEQPRAPGKPAVPDGDEARLAFTIHSEDLPAPKYTAATPTYLPASLGS